MQPEITFTRQPEITFTQKLIRMRKAAGKANHKQVMGSVVNIERLIRANGYGSRNDAITFFVSHSDIIKQLIPGEMKKLDVEFESLINNLKTT